MREIDANEGYTPVHLLAFELVLGVGRNMMDGQTNIRDNVKHGTFRKVGRTCDGRTDKHEEKKGIPDNR